METFSLLKYHALKMVRDLLTARGEESKPSQNFRVGMRDIILWNIIPASCTERTLPLTRERIARRASFI